MSDRTCENRPFEGKAFSFFNHSKCEYFPCHKTDSPEDFNCLFCYCPLYALGDHCGGNFVITGGVKDCSECLLPHRREGYGIITGKFREIMELEQKSRSGGATGEL